MYFKGFNSILQNIWEDTICELLEDLALFDLKGNQPELKPSERHYTMAPITCHRDPM